MNIMLELLHIPFVGDRLSRAVHDHFRGPWVIALFNQASFERCYGSERAQYARKLHSAREASR